MRAVALPAAPAHASVWLQGAPLLAPALAFLVGITIGPALPALPVFLLAVPALPALVALLSRRFGLLAACALGWLLLAGAVRSQTAALPAADDVSYFNGRFVELVGVVDSEPDLRDRSALLHVRVTAVAGGTRTHPTWRPTSGLVQLRVPLTPAYAYGDVLDLRGQLAAPPVLPGFDYGAFLARQGVRSVMAYAAITPVQRGAGDPIHAAIYALRQRIVAALAVALPEPEASLQRAILIGSRSATFSDLTPDFVRTGMIHIIATSGFKVAIAGGTLLGLLTPLVGRRRAVLPALLGVAVYILLTGATPAGIRAGLMWALALGALLAGRPAASLQALTLAAVAMVAVQPAVLTDSGFQLSAGATAGILVLQPRWQRWLRHLPPWLAEPVGVTLAAQVGTLPVTMTGFHQVSLVAPLANLLCLPVLPAEMAAGAGVATLAAISPALGHSAGYLAYGFLAYTIAVVRLLAQVPGAALAAPSATVLFAALYYAGCLAILPLLPAPGAPEGRAHAAGGLALGVALMFAVPLFTAAFSGPPARTELTLLDVGQGDALVVRDTAGQVVLIDAGPSAQAALAQLGELLPFWKRQLDGVVLLGAEGAHVGAVPQIAARYALGRVLLPTNATRPSKEADAVRQALRTDAITLLPPNSASFQTAGGVGIEVWPVGTASAPHLLARLQVGGATVLDAAALSAADQRRLATSGTVSLGAMVLVAPGGAAATALDPAFLAAVQPAIMLAGALPSKAVSADVGEAALLRTDQLGAIHLTLDGQGVSVN